MKTYNGFTENELEFMIQYIAKKEIEMGTTCMTENDRKRIHKEALEECLKLRENRPV